MRPENKALLAVVLTVVVAVGIVGAYLIATPRATTLPIPAGTVLLADEARAWVVYFNVTDLDSRIVGGWAAFDGAGSLALIVVNGSVAKPSGALLHCPLMTTWAQSNGSIDRRLDPGPHTLFWSAGLCAQVSRIVVTDTIQVVSIGT